MIKLCSACGGAGGHEQANTDHSAIIFKPCLVCNTTGKHVSESVKAFLDQSREGFVETDGNGRASFPAVPMAIQEEK